MSGSARRIHAENSLLSITSRDNDYRTELSKSQSKVLEIYQINGAEFKKWFATAFARYLRDRFTYPEEVAVQFGVRNSTAYNWWNGDNKASGDSVALAFMTMPDAVAWFTQEWAAR